MRKENRQCPWPQYVKEKELFVKKAHALLRFLLKAMLPCSVVQMKVQLNREPGPAYCLCSANHRPSYWSSLPLWLAEHSLSLLRGSLVPFRLTAFSVSLTLWRGHSSTHARTHTHTHPRVRIFEFCKCEIQLQRHEKKMSPVTHIMINR